MLLNRKFFSCFALLALAGCGFSPLYGGEKGAAASAGLETVQVQTIPNRSGQVLYQTLQQDFYTNGAPTQALYQLSVDYSIEQIGEGVQEDSSTSRTRFVAVAHWRLSAIGEPSKTLKSGQAMAMDGLNILDQQYFAATLETETVDKQLANEIAAQMTTQLAAWFRAHPGS